MLYLLSLYLMTQEMHTPLSESLTPKGIVLTQTRCDGITSQFPKNFDSEDHQWSEHIKRSIGGDPKPFVRHGFKHQIAIVCKKDPGLIETIAITGNRYLKNTSLKIGMSHLAVERILQKADQASYLFHKNHYYIYTIINPDESTVSFELINDALTTISLGKYGKAHLQRVKKFSKKL